MPTKVPTLTIACLLVSVVLSGCTGTTGSDPASGTLETEADGLRDPMVRTWAGGMTAVGVCQEPGEAMVGEFSNPSSLSVPANTTTLLVELEWDPGVMDVCVSIEGPDGIDHRVTREPAGMLEGYIRAEIQNPVPGPWSLMVTTNGLGDLQYQGAASMFFGPVPPGYSGL